MEFDSQPSIQEEIPKPTGEFRQSQSQPEEKGNIFTRFWFIFIALAIVALLIVGGLWFTNQGLLTKPTPSPTPIPSPSSSVDETTSNLEKQGTSDELAEIEKDLEATDLSNLDKGLTDIENELSLP